MNTIPGSAEREALLQSLAADQAALAEMSQTFEEIKAEIHQELVESLRRNTQEAQRLHDEWKQSQLWSNSQLPFFPNGRVPPSHGHTLALFMAAFVVVAIILGVLILLS